MYIQVFLATKQPKMFMTIFMVHVICIDILCCLLSLKSELIWNYFVLSGIRLATPLHTCYQVIITVLSCGLGLAALYHWGLWWPKHIYGSIL